ncbi:hypothetical protein [Nocardia puris]|uniref:Uncharacterized protein n=1 Tax=Nocardia puris TaxID=208602 RepID=A0A366CW60_9NOCA|nr:hypothetical protein [Nocardia puris]RBO82060.1 hypothetical protein DFR74_12515 [Nocardia puris]
MTRPTNVVNLVREQVLEQIESRIAAVVSAAEADARRRLETFLADLPRPGEEPPDPRADARERATRTALQGALATVVVAVLLAAGTVIAGDGFDFTSGGDWKAVAGAALAAAIAAGTAYVQRLVAPPGGGR